MRMGPWWQNGRTQINRWSSFLLNIIIFLIFLTHLPSSAVIGCKLGRFPNAQNIHPIHLNTKTIASKCHWNTLEQKHFKQTKLIMSSRKIKREKPYPEARNVVSPLVVVRAGRRPLHRRAHAVPVVLTDEDGGQLPKRRHIIGFKNLTLWNTQRVSFKNTMELRLEVYSKVDLLQVCL